MGGDGEAGGGSDCVKVAIRCRPPSQKEISNNEQSIVEMNDSYHHDGEMGQVVLTDPSGHDEPSTFAFDIVFGLSVHQSQIYESVGRPALQKTFEGYNGTIFAYGQTGSGKSFTMSGVANNPELKGIIPRVNEELFQHIEQEQVGTRKFLVMCSFFEIYNEIIFDLLNPVADRSKLGGGLQIKEHPVMGIYVKDLTEIVAEDTGKLEALLDGGSKNRAVSSTLMNSTSSRSHSIFTIKVNQRDSEDTSRNVFAKLNLVDLAGSERQKGTGATGQTLKEGANINKSLSALGNVINALVECANGKKVFIPYRNSKLTRVLQESLGGNSLCTMLATLSPAACNYEETMSTLRYANRAKAIKVSATKNEEASQISRLQAEVEELKKKLAGGGGSGGGGLSEAEREAEKANFMRQLKEMEQMMSNNWGEKAKLSEEHERQMQKLAEEQRRAAQALEEERFRRLRLLEEKNDLELSVRGFTDLLSHLPKFRNPPPVLAGDQPRQWLKMLRSLRQQVDELREHRTMVLVFKHAFDGDVQLWGEGLEVGDLGLAATGLTRAVPKLDKFKKGSEKLLQLEADALGTASELAEAVQQALSELEAFGASLSEAGAVKGVDAGDEEKAAKVNSSAALLDVTHILSLVQKQASEKLEELQSLACVEMGSSCQPVLLFAEKCLEDAPPEVVKDFELLKGFIADPNLAFLPSGLPSKPLHEYQVSDVQDTPETTEAVLGQLVRWEGLCGGKSRKPPSELLARPPPKFVMDVAVAVKAATGYPPAVLDWPEARDDRLARLSSIANAVSATLGVGVDFDPTDVLKGKEVQTTLRLMQLLAVAAARSQPAQAQVAVGAAPAGLTRPRGLLPMLSAIDRCIQAARRTVESQRQQETSAATPGEQSLEAKVAEMQRLLQEESRVRLQEAEALADEERKLEEAKAEMRKISIQRQLAQASKGEDGTDPEVAELQRQLQVLTSGAGTQNEAELLRMLASQLEDLRRSLQQSENDVAELEQSHQELEAAVAESQATTRRLEADVLRERAMCEQELELEGQTPEEQKLILQAQQSKLRTKAETLEAQITQLHAEAEQHKLEKQRLIEERNDLKAKADDAHLQMQIVQEERDAMREAMEQLWNEKNAVDEELQNMQQAYINLSDSLCTKQDEADDLESLVFQKKDEVQGLSDHGRV